MNDIILLGFGSVPLSLAVYVFMCAIYSSTQSNYRCRASKEDESVVGGVVW